MNIHPLIHLADTISLTDGDPHKELSIGANISYKEAQTDIGRTQVISAMQLAEYILYKRQQAHRLSIFPIPEGTKQITVRAKQPKQKKS